ncbi:MAG TPA: glycosyltransferase family 4 protein [Spirochaetota bacterium]|nr:glycosyltransferase family 4 protein [Spirochaetota bacterium]HQJ71289.1 glycosyltransferase family 4 protein [Spirochaetota bacterium]HRS77657.1 glycosyltransferase family 4 protein [Spirochaetota bacterium]HRT75718.1 glycosyltransferase family 4 protein [Spirochaetota bacterium]
MDIFWITSNHPPDTGGMARSSERIVNGLRDRGHAVTVLHLSENDYPEAADNGLVVTSGSRYQSEPERLFWHYRDAMAKSMIAGFGGNHAGYYAVIWARWLKTKSLVLYRGNDFDRIIHDLKRGWITHAILDNADLVGAVSTEMASRIRTLREKPVLYTPNSVEPAEWTLLKTDIVKSEKFRDSMGRGEKSVIAMFGDLKSKKGLDIALALFTTYEFRERAMLLTVGTISDMMSERLAAGLGNSWFHVPFQKREAMALYYAASDIVFLPSFYDGMPNVLLEAMALGKIIVASRAGAFPDVIRDGENGFLFSTGDMADAARTMNRALNMKETARAAMIESARKTIAEDFNPRKEIEIIEKGIAEYLA